METQTAVTPLRAGDRRQRQFQQHGTPKPIFFDKVRSYKKIRDKYNIKVLNSNERCGILSPSINNLQLVHINCYLVENTFNVGP